MRMHGLGMLIRDSANLKRDAGEEFAEGRDQRSECQLTAPDRGGSMRRSQTGGSHPGKAFFDALSGTVGRFDGKPICSSTIRREA